MFSRNLIALTFLILSALVFQVDAGSLIPKVTAADFTGVKVIAGDKLEIQTSAAPDRISPILTSAQTSIAPWTPLAENLIVNTTVPQGETAQVGWRFSDADGAAKGDVVHDGFAKNITMFVTPPGSTEEVLFGLEVNPDTHLCGILSGVGFWLFVDATDLGTYKARWNVEFGQSTQPDAPIDPDSGCGPLPFDSTTVEFVRYWEVVEAE
ncbi:hypothetical protein C8J57DRAFT_1223848 [Mycena rebaudengoi]|nr:hypothetical protein C8J57DRAFT_1223848 [Mycena rebaudengoi]